MNSFELNQFSDNTVVHGTLHSFLKSWDAGHSDERFVRKLFALPLALHGQKN